MTDERKIEMLRQMMDGDETDSGILGVYLELAAQKILNKMYPYTWDYTEEDLTVPDRYVGIQLNVACYLLNKRGAEGQIQHIENGIHRNYGSSDVPDEMLNAIIPFSKAIR